MIMTMGSILYGLFATILTVYRSERLRSDLWKFVSVSFHIIRIPFTDAVKACCIAWKVKDMIPQTMLGTIAALLFVILTFALIAGSIYGLAGYLAYRFVNYYRKNLHGTLNGIIALISMILIVWFGARLTFIPWNLVGIWFLIQGLYLILRMIVKTINESTP